MGSKCVDELMKLVGLHYLQGTLKEIIDKVCIEMHIYIWCSVLLNVLACMVEYHWLYYFQIFLEHKNCEIDPTRLKDGDNLAANMVRHSKLHSFVL